MILVTLSTGGSFIGNTTPLSVLFVLSFIAKVALATAPTGPRVTD